MRTDDDRATDWYDPPMATPSNAQTSLASADNAPPGAFAKFLLWSLGAIVLLSVAAGVLLFVLARQVFNA
jgi:hypothetical protein